MFLMFGVGLEVKYSELPSSRRESKRRRTIGVNRTLFAGWGGILAPGERRIIEGPFVGASMVGHERWPYGSVAVGRKSCLHEVASHIINGRCSD